jgi:hypothetical protein
MRWIPGLTTRTRCTRHASIPTGRARPSSWFGADGWTQTSTLALLDLVVAVHSDDPALIALVEDLYAPTISDAAPEHALFLGRARVDGAAGYFAAVDGGILVRTAAPGVAFRHLVYAANQLAIDATAAPVRLHAAAVGRAGRALALVGPMGAGKSTLAAALVQRGWDYLTDEVVAIDGDGSVRPYAKPCSLGDPPPALEPLRWDPPQGSAVYLAGGGLVPAPILGTVAGAAVELGGVVLTSYRRDAATAITELGRADALVEIGAHAFGLSAPGSLRALDATLARVPCFRLVSGDLHGACDAVESVVGVRT